MQNPQKPIPDRLSNRYDVLCVLGDGGFGTTFLVRDSQMPSARKCVLKQLKPVHDNPEIYRIVQERFGREAAILEQLGEHHKQIPRLYAYFSEGDRFYLVEEWIEGETLRQRAARSGTQPEATVRSILTQLLPAIEYVHQQQIVHRDIKPDNIILRTPDDLPVLIDFGAVKETMSTIVNSQGNSSHSIVVGTPGFMPPEQMAGRPVYSSDLYSLGMTAIYLLTGKIPQELRTDPRTGELIWQEYVPQVSSAFAAVLNRAVQQYPQQRFSSAQEMLTALTTGMPIPATVLSAPPMPVSMPVHTVALSQPNPASQVIPSQTSNSWKKPVAIGAIIGVSILGGALLLRSYLPDASEPSEQKEATRPTLEGDLPKQSDPSTSATPQASPISQPPQSVPTATPSPQPSQAPAQSVAPANSSPSQTTPPRTSSGSDDAPQTNPQAAPAKADNPQQAPVRSDSTETTNATIVGDPGATNIRTGPGTKFPPRHIAYPGDRVRILSTSRDDNGNLWYKIYFPISKADGWIFGQLLKPD